MTTKHKTLGISDTELDLNCVDKEAVAGIYPQRTMIQCGICVICKNTENMPKDCAPGSACFMQPGTLAWRLVHCDAPKCEATAQYIFNDYLANNKRFFVTKKTVDNLFAVRKVFVPRSNGTVTEGKIDWMSPCVVNDADEICIFCDIDNGDMFKAVSLEKLMKHNPELRECWRNSTQKFHVLYETQLELDHLSLIQKIDANVSMIDALLTSSF